MGLKIEGYTAFERGGATRLGRIRGNDGSYITQAALSTITYMVFTVTNSGTTFTPVEGGTGTLLVANLIFDSLQLNGLWRKDTIGFNYKWAMPASLLAVGNTIYRFELKFTPAVGFGEVFWDAFNINTLDIHTPA